MFFCIILTKNINIKSLNHQIVPNGPANDTATKRGVEDAAPYKVGIGAVVRQKEDP